MVFEQVQQIIAEHLGLEASKIRLDSDMEGLGADSFDMYDMIESFEEKFDIEIPDEHADKIKNVGDFVKFIENHVDN
ncbi:MAG: acyl carrier protein [Oscillospiraceae bacterium]|jgi:acyl carrier protein|nr:acyl carrier protein [Oscillospiraceae bacterium]